MARLVQSRNDVLMSDITNTPARVPIDRAGLLEQCLDSLSFALQMLDEFATTSPSRLAAFDAALVERDGDAIATQAHAFKGVAGVLAANTLSGTCERLESAAKVEDWNQTRDLIQPDSPGPSSLLRN